MKGNKGKLGRWCSDTTPPANVPLIHPPNKFTGGQQGAGWKRSNPAPCSYKDWEGQKSTTPNPKYKPINC